MENAETNAARLIEKYGLDKNVKLDASSPLPGLPAADREFLDYLETGINTDYTMEKFLVKLRRFLLTAYLGGGEFPGSWVRLTAAVAGQCFNNEYIFYETLKEEQAVKVLEKRFGPGVTGEQLKEWETGLAVLGMYRPLFRLPLAEGLKDIPVDTFSPLLTACLRRLLYEPLAVRELKRTIPPLAAITRHVSQAVQRQYDENPYPRWFEFPRRRKPLAARLADVFPGVVLPQVSGTEKRRILVPGCGTGRHPLVLAAADPDAEVIAVDLSQESLAYGKRMAGKLGISNVSFLHGDLLDIPRMGMGFHHIDCVGVLHHQEARMAGWRALNRVILPGGTMYIGVYSDVARMQTTFLRKEIAAMNLRPRVKDIKKLRRLVLTRKRYKPIIEKFKGSRDFYALSTLRDMLFHVCENGYTLREIQATIEELALTFLGFKFNYAPMTDKYRACFPGDPGMNCFENWLQFERAYVATGLMFLFWLQKPPDGREPG
jgi:SAM-dependent methyltransferase